MTRVAARWKCRLCLASAPTGRSGWTRHYLDTHYTPRAAS
jgi:hypothetical protein